MGAYQHTLAAQGLQVVVVYHLQAGLAQALHLGAVVHNVAQTVEAAGLGQLLLGGAYGFHHSKAVACVLVDQYFHRLKYHSRQLMLWFSWRANSSTSSYSSGVRSL